ncbi:uncharacterized protein SCODWIG_02203 [Saccharomycodes ludwigii]|uniref:Mediator of RNA polymerase II transcription subunit 4 n=1 Tax=Saccharomycodes ludwigii TaxID=36035 RepID=A0A376B718_9ASCO|nr:hypothetical protein SCDLUD_000902 [Saccharomycodes ludwigii]KAH3903277.1 hypothetical protein SCDLUD_000902 [Saccharomycodes ludwigii]SSD60442.1 uncharacterized protein SCODWIG_02203 [Saccharomycodes ludwigii]
MDAQNVNNTLLTSPSSKNFSHSDNNVNNSTLKSNVPGNTQNMAGVNNINNDADNFGITLLPSNKRNMVTTTAVIDPNINVKNNDIKLPVLYNIVDQYEKNIENFVETVDSFKPSLPLASKIIETDSKLMNQLNEFPKYDQMNKNLMKLNEYETNLQNNIHWILTTLNDCYMKLNRLPMEKQVKIEQKIILKQRENIKTKLLLDYSMKLAKFTKIPPTLNREMIGPSNFIWPGEDSLRRGMLALSSLKEKESIKKKEEEETQHQKQLEQEQEQKENTKTSNGDEENSFIFNGTHKNKENQNDSNRQEEQNIVNKQEDDHLNTQQKNHHPEESGEAEDDEDLDLDLDLDLFNPDEF